MVKKVTAYKEAKKQPFIREFRKIGTIGEACARVKISRSAVDTWRKEDPEFIAAFVEAESHVTECLENALFNRATKGVENDVFFQGERCGTKTEYSDTAAIFLLKCRNPQKYSEKFLLEHSGKVGTSIEVFIYCVTNPPQRLNELIEHGNSNGNGT